MAMTPAPRSAAKRVRCTASAASRGNEIAISSSPASMFISLPAATSVPPNSTTLTSCRQIERQLFNLVRGCLAQRVVHNADLDCAAALIMNHESVGLGIDGSTVETQEFHLQLRVGQGFTGEPSSDPIGRDGPEIRMDKVQYGLAQQILAPIGAEHLDRGGVDVYQAALFVHGNTDG